MELRFGIERETHRMAPDGNLSGRTQPAELRAPEFTKDFAETQLEIVTRPHGSIPSLLSELGELTEKAAGAVEPDLLWPFSMPPRLPPDRDITIASLGRGEKAREGELYRRGLALRYGAARQMICGLHVNVSVGDLGGPDVPHLALARNLYRDLPHLILLTGASPLPGGLPIQGREPAVSYRNSPDGYAGREFRPYLDLTSVRAYAAGLRRGLSTESERFRSLGLVREGEGVQLNAKVFQREKEFYAPIRLKRIPDGESNGLLALERRGVEYLELRFFDIDPFDPNGISPRTLALLELFIRDDLSRPPGSGSTGELGVHLDSAEAAALFSVRGPRRSSPERAAGGPLLSRARVRLESLMPLARNLDAAAAVPGISYRDALEEALEMTGNPALLPSARLLAAFEESGIDWTSFGLETARRHSLAAERRPA
jgi:glutamate--cysteine ligase